MAVALSTSSTQAPSSVTVSAAPNSTRASAWLKALSLFKFKGGGIDYPASFLGMVGWKRG